jgi:hypothetical protein
VGDVYFPQTKLLLPFEGTNGATTTSDLSNSNYSMTMGGSTTISSAKSKVGSTSLYNPGGAGNYGAYSSSALTLSGDFTIEWWEWVVSYVNEGCSFLLNKAGLTTNTWTGIMGGYHHAATNASASGIYATSNNSSWDLASHASGHLLGAHLTGQWVHRAVVRVGINWYTYQNGVQYDTWASSAAAPYASGVYTLVGGGWADAHNNMYVDNFRITSGIARYTSAFTPPSTAYLTSAGDVNKQVLINSTADGVAIGAGGINQARIAKAWVNFNGSGTVAIRGSYNISSITDNGTGDYTLNYSTSLGDENYTVIGCTGNTASAAGTVFTSTWVASLTTALTSSATRVIGVYRTGTSNVNWDGADLYYQVFGN